MKVAGPQMIHLKDYQVPSYLISDIQLEIHLDDRKTKVLARTHFHQNAKSTETSGSLFLNGENIKLLNLAIDGKKLSAEQYKLSAEGLTLFNLPEQFVLEVENETNPSENKTLEGLYKSGEIFCTQCEAEGFRKITFYMDRPDVMAKFTTKIVADKKYPILLSNGNLEEKGDLPGGKHFAVWKDPFKKPCYLYALVAGDLGQISGQHITTSGRKVQLEIYCDKGNEQRCHFALESLINAMKWDEKRFNLEYDLDIYMIVAVGAFNFGAMENKGLNIFNSVYVLADNKTATDDNFHGIEGVVGHEYFHNWSGNRVTCRDWFQLTLKEGLTVYRDQEFSADMNSPVVQRISDVERLRSAQFSEDAGPNAHPIRPPSYATIDNFYTPTIYEKGAEVIRMIEAMVGKEGINRGVQKYFELFDGQAVTTEDFIYAMEEANDLDLTQFKRWYSNAGTPEVHIHADFDEEKHLLTLAIEQSRRPGRFNSKEEIAQNPLHIPFVFGALDPLTNDEVINQVLHLKENKQTFTFKGIKRMPYFSFNRHFMAPIKVNYAHSIKELSALMSSDTDLFNRYEAHQVLSMRLIKGLIKDVQNKQDLKLHPEYVEAFLKLLKEPTKDWSYKAKCLQLPRLGLIAQEMNPIDHQSIFTALQFVQKSLAKAAKTMLLNDYQLLTQKLKTSYQKNEVRSAEAIGMRAYCLQILEYLCVLEEEESFQLCHNLFIEAQTMTEQIGALALLCNYNNSFKEKSLQQFRQQWESDALVMQKWLAVQAASSIPGTLEIVKRLETLPFYDKTIPNFVRSLIGQFGNNPLAFHRLEDAKFLGHEFLTDKILEIDGYNPQLAARLMGPYNDLRRLPPEVQESLRKQLLRIQNQENISKNCLELATKILE